MIQYCLFCIFECDSVIAAGSALPSALATLSIVFPDVGRIHVSNNKVSFISTQENYTILSQHPQQHDYARRAVKASDT